MKTLLSLLFSACAFGQVTFNIQVATESPVAITMSTEAVASGTNTIMGTVGPGTSPTTLATAVTTTGQTAIQVNNIIGVTTCMGLLMGSELSTVTGISGSSPPYTLTVIRGVIGTTKSTYSNGTAVSYTAWGSSSCYVAGLFAIAAQLGMVNKPGPAVAAQQAAIVTANATIATTVAAGVTHVP